MITIVVSIIGGIVLLAVEMFMISANLISVGAVTAIETYQRIKWWNFLIIYMIVSVGVDSFFGYNLGTYLISILLLVLIHSSGKKVLPYDRTFIRIGVLLLSFIAFHVSRNVLIAIQISTIANLDIFQLLLSSFVRSLVETGLVLIVTYLIKTYLGSDITSVKVRV